MGFFDEVSRPATRPHGVWERPQAVIPSTIGLSAVMAHNEHAAVAVTGLWVYPTGFEFLISARVRATPAPDYSAEDDPIHKDFLRIGVQFADGRRGTNLSDPPESTPPPAETDPILTPTLFGAGPDWRDWRYWVWPMPPGGNLLLVCQWPAFHIPEIHTEFDAQMILDAVDNNVPLWGVG